MKLTNKRLKLRIEIRDDLLTQMVERGQNFYPKEYGGILVGRYVDSDRLVIIEDMVLPKNYRSSAYSFERGNKGLKEALAKHFESNPSLTYVGEWHTHPNSSTTPSTTDTNALRQIAQHDNVFIENPILVIIALTRRGHEFGFYVWYHNRVCCYEEERISLSN